MLNKVFIYVENTGQDNCTVLNFEKWLDKIELQCSFLSCHRESYKLNFILVIMYYLNQLP